MWSSERHPVTFPPASLLLRMEKVMASLFIRWFIMRIVWRMMSSPVRVPFVDEERMSKPLPLSATVMSVPSSLWLMVTVSRFSPSSPRSPCLMAFSTRIWTNIVGMLICFITSSAGASTSNMKSSPSTVRSMST